MLLFGWYLGFMEDTYGHISKNILSYIPSKLLVVLNVLFIIPLLSYLFSEKEMSFYLIAIYIVNILCTCTSDWITKTIIRFHEKYNLNSQLDNFYSSIFWLIIFANILISILFVASFGVLSSHFGVSNSLLIQTLCVLLPCGIRQFLFQFLRVTNRSFLYTSAIFFYQVLFILFILLFYKFNNTDATFIILAMNIAIMLIDIYIIKQTKLDFKIKFRFDKEILFEIIKYGSPLIITNICYWLTLHFSKLYFQERGLFLCTAILGLCMLLVNNIIQAVASSFIFAAFPVIVERYEHRKDVKKYWTMTLQLYLFFMLPIVMTFCFMFKEITHVFLPEKYYIGAVTLPLFAISVFAHELLKLITVKYHLKNVTHTESLISFLIVLFSIFLNLILINAYELVGAAIALLITEILFLLVNVLVKVKRFEEFSIPSTLRTICFVLAIGVVVYFLNLLLANFLHNFITSELLINIIKILSYAGIFYSLCFVFRNRILKYL